MIDKQMWLNVILCQLKPEIPDSNLFMSLYKGSYNLEMVAVRQISMLNSNNFLSKPWLIEYGACCTCSWGKSYSLVFMFKTLDFHILFQLQVANCFCRTRF